MYNKNKMYVNNIIYTCIIYFIFYICIYPAHRYRNFMSENYIIVMYMFKYYIITNVYIYLLLIDYLKHFRSSNKLINVF